MTRPKIPSPMQREVRQRCGYTCIFCGSLIWDYHHIVPWNVCKTHEADNLTLLCKQHHDDVTSGRISDEDVIAANDQPFGRSQNFYDTYQILLKPLEEIAIAGLRITGDLEGKEVTIIRYLGTSIFSIRVENGRPIISLELSERDGSKALSIEENVIKFASNYFSDINFVGPRFQARDAGGAIVLDFRLKNSSLELEYLEFWAGDCLIATNRWSVVMTGGNLETNRFNSNTIEMPVAKIEPGFTIYNIDPKSCDSWGLFRGSSKAFAGNVTEKKIRKHARASLYSEKDAEYSELRAQGDVAAILEWFSRQENGNKK